MGTSQVTKTSKQLTTKQLFLIGFLIMIVGSYVVSRYISQMFGGLLVWAGLFIWIAATVQHFRNKKFKKKSIPVKYSLNELISKWSISILRATLVGWTENDLVNETCSATRYKKDIYSVAGMVYLAEHMISRNVDDKSKIENFASKLLSKVADDFAENMCNDSTTRADKAKVSNLVKKAYFYFWDKKEASENSPKGVTDVIIERLHTLDNSLDKNELEGKLGKHLVAENYADFANIASHLINNPNKNSDNHL